MRASLVLALAASTFCVPAQEQTTAPDPAAIRAQRLQDAVDEMVVLVEKHAGLVFRRPPKVRATTHREWRELVAEQMQLETAAEVFDAAVGTFGLYLVDEDEVALSPLVVTQLLTELDEDASRQVREGVAHQRATIAHELVHALQEQHFGLLSRLRSTDEADPDELFRLRLLVEGHAVLVEEQIAEHELGLEDFFLSGPYAGIGVDPAYVTGRRYFLHVLRTDGMSAVHDRLADPPTFAEMVALANARLPPPATRDADGMSATADPAARPPNVLIVLADDLGYGDVRCYNPRSKVATPNLDRLAADGIRFTDAHSPATVCTPTRYSLLTGRMCFRTGYRSVFVGVGGPCLIEPERATLPGVLRDVGYETMMVGKWHVGLTFLDSEGARVTAHGNDGVRAVDWSRPIPDAPVHRGFDRFFGTASCPTTDWLYAWIEGDRVPNPPSMTETRDRDALPKHPYSDDCRGGLIASDFDLEQVDLVFLERSKAWLREHVEERADQPFFLLHSMQAVHLPSFAADRFEGATDAGPHGDFLHEMDFVVGELLATLAELGVDDDTLVIFCSDNGPEVGTVIQMRQDHDHDGARPWRGMKRDQWEGGHRTPLIVRWPGRVDPGSTTDQPVSLTDLFATLATIAGAELPDDAAEDSFDMSGALLLGTDEPIRPYLLQQTMSAQLSIRRGAWKYLDHRGSGGNDYSKPRLAPYRIAHGDEDAPGQLYDLEEDPGETHNLYSRHPEVVAELKALLDATKASGRSAPPRGR